MPGDSPDPVPPLAEVIALSGISLPNEIPYTHIAFTIVVWNDAPRLAKLLRHVRPFFTGVHVVVQSSTDGTLDVAREYADVVIEDKHRGFGDASYGPKLLPTVQAPWTLKIDADEWPSADLLFSLSSATWYADHVARTKGVWIPFRSSVDGIEYTEQHAHLRLFHISAGWPALMHSRPPINNGILWQTGHIRHDRSLDEMIIDYLRYLELGKTVPGWVAHNTLMIRSACEGTASVKGWDYVKGHAWWPQVEPLMT